MSEMPERIWIDVVCGFRFWHHGDDGDWRRVEYIRADIAEADIADAQIAELMRWKAEQLEVESTWNAQDVGNALGLQWGSRIREGILPAILAMKEQIAELTAALGELCAVTNRDGGEYLAEHGPLKASELGKANYYEWVKRADLAEYELSTYEEVECDSISCAEGKQLFGPCPICNGHKKHMRKRASETPATGEEE